MIVLQTFHQIREWLIKKYVESLLNKNLRQFACTKSDDESKI
jgi:hypothetical protein